MRLRAALAAAMLLSACGSADRTGDAPGSGLPSAATGAAPERDYAPPPLVPEAAKGEKGARNLLLSWAAAMEDRAFAQAYALFGEYAERTGQSEADYLASLASYRTVTVAIGEGEVEGAAGSLYYQAPVTLTGQRRDGSDYRRAGTITLRRVNDVPGAAPAQLRWHLDSLAWSN